MLIKAKQPVASVADALLDLLNWNNSFRSYSSGWQGKKYQTEHPKQLESISQHFFYIGPYLMNIKWHLM